MDLDYLDGVIGDFGPYQALRSMEDDDWDDLAAIRLICNSNRRRRSIKFFHNRKNWDEHVEMFLSTGGEGGFDNRFRMPYNHFMYLVNKIRDAITVNFLKSHQSTGGNDPIYPEIVAAVGLRFLGPGDSIAVLADLYGMSISSCKRCINMFLNAIDYNTDCVEMRVELPDPSDHSALRNLAQAWSSVSTAFDLFNYNLGCLDV